jgi:serine/threonine protein kinase
MPPDQIQPEPNQPGGPEARATSPASASPSESRAFGNIDDDFGLKPQPRARLQLVDPLLGADLGGFKILRLIGEGGMGRVYEAQQLRPSRTVAVKVIRLGLVSEKTMRRFEREAEFLAKLQHTGIAQIFMVGSYSSDYGEVPFYVMEFIENAKPITHYVQEKSLSHVDRLRLFKQVCDAVSYGHDRGVVHRDLKPGNILIDMNGAPKIIDFGVARSTDSDLQITSMKTDTGQVVGTVQYMSPEQFGDSPDDLDTRVDVYSLGVVLYEMLAGVPPYDVRKKGIHEAARIVCERIPEPLRARDSTIPRAASDVTTKCLQKDRRARYFSAADLGLDVQRCLDGQPVLASQSGVLSRLGRTSRHRLLQAALVSCVVGLGFWAYSRISAGRLSSTAGPIPDASPVETQPSWDQEAAAIRAVMEANFQAMNEENVPRLLGTCSSECPDLDEFAKEARDLFRETDVCVSLAGFELLSLGPLEAKARITQITLPADERDRTRGLPRQVFFKSRSALLPKWESCQYTQSLKKENGRWKLYLIEDEPRPVEASVTITAGPQ